MDLKKILSLLCCSLLLVFSGCDSEEDYSSSDTLTSITITSLPDKIKYSASDTALDTTGLVVTANYRSGRMKAIPKDELSFKGFDEDADKAVASKTITVSYGNGDALRYAQFQISYSDLANIQITKSAKNVVYVMKDFLQASTNASPDISQMTLDTTGLEVTATFYDNGTKVIPLTDENISITGFDAAEAFRNNLSSQTVKISYTYDGAVKEANFTVNFKWGENYKGNSTKINLTKTPTEKIVDGYTMYVVDDKTYGKIGNSYCLITEKSDSTIINEDMKVTRGGYNLYLGSDGNYYIKLSGKYYVIPTCDLSNIQVTKSPTNVIYVMKDFLEASTDNTDISKMKFDTTGLEVTASFYENASKVISLTDKNLSISGFDPVSAFKNNLTSQTVKISYTYVDENGDPEDTKETCLTVSYKWAASYKFTETAMYISGYGVVGSVMKLGDFPQTLKADSVEINEGVNLTRGGLTMYLGSDGNYYVKHMNEFFYNSGRGDKCGSNGDIKYFKVEPLEWVAFETATIDYGTEKESMAAFYYSKKILNSGINYYKYASKRTLTQDETTYSITNGFQCRTTTTYNYTITPASFRYSTLRDYLNGDNENSDSTYDGKGFLQSAFTEQAREVITAREIDEVNYCVRTIRAYHYDKDKTEYISGENDVSTVYTTADPNIGKTTYKVKVWLIGANGSYGYGNSSIGIYNSHLSMPDLEATDYAIANNYDYIDSSEGNYNDNKFWLATDYIIRKEICPLASYITVKSDGYTECTNSNSVGQVQKRNLGIVPCIMLRKDAAHSY